MALRTGIKNFECIADVVCGDEITTIWGNGIRDVAQSGFERGETVFSAPANYILGPIWLPIVGLAWNYIKGAGFGSNTDVRWSGSVPSIRYQPTIPYEKNISLLYLGNENNNTPLGSGENNFGMIGHRYELARFENAGYNTIQVEATVRRGARNIAGSPNITATLETQILLTNEDDNDPVMYVQHIQCWYCRENPAGPSFAPLKVLLFDDNDCPLRTYAHINKQVTLPFPPDTSETELDYLVVSMWYGAPHLYEPMTGTYTEFWPDGDEFIVNGLSLSVNDLRNGSVHSDGIRNMTVKLFKQC